MNNQSNITENNGMFPTFWETDITLFLKLEITHLLLSIYFFTCYRFL